MTNLGLTFAYLFIQILNLVLVVGLPLALALFVYRWMTDVRHTLERLEERLGTIEEQMDELLDTILTGERQP